MSATKPAGSPQPENKNKEKQGHVAAEQKTLLSDWTEQYEEEEEEEARRVESAKVFAFVKK